MFITVIILPNIHSVLSPNKDELLLWERLVRFVTRQPPVSPYESWSKPSKRIWVPVKILYHMFAAFTHVYSQVLLHTSAAIKYESYMELTKRWNRFRFMNHEQKFHYVDTWEFGKINL